MNWSHIAEISTAILLAAFILAMVSVVGMVIGKMRE
jgi:hypothetical protein